MDKQAWTQELLWVQRNSNGVIIGVREVVPPQGEIVPVVPRKDTGRPAANVIGD
ncbi:hypothetical protein I8J29_24640 [Paenibacillus sp. MWE-103]|uniref:Uncharacterized protein n=1 Tax=Paenibacillus artemisiicola TaxID=1172618 RepID=A0ABS3WGD7_9BACL|nr:hypothetical protein [Paenibacillus artemisiicola]MBO7747378.1 hypothetical protein [Paenibacillus artemisiicola]